MPPVSDSHDVDYEPGPLPEVKPKSYWDTPSTRQIPGKKLNWRRVMATNRIVYQDWIVELGFDPAEAERARDEALAGPSSRETAENLRVERIREAVQAALKELTDDEKELIERLHYMGQTYAELAESSGRAVHRLEAIYRRAVRKLRRNLAPLVKEMYGLSGGRPRDCPICASLHRRAIDRIIEARDRQKTWRPVMVEIERRFGLKIATPQILIGHSKYH